MSSTRGLHHLVPEAARLFAAMRPRPADLLALNSLARYGATLTGVALAAARRGADRTVLVDGDGPVDGRELEAAADQVARGLIEPLRRSGGGPVAAICGSHRGLVATAVAAGALGVGLRLVDPAAGRERIASATSGSAVLVHDEHADLGEAPGLRLPIAGLLASSRPAGLHLRGAPPPRRPGRIELLTSGTTGAPRATTRGRARASQLPTIFSLLAALGLRRGEPVLLAPPLPHGHGLSLLVAALAVGAPVILGHGRTPAEMIDLMHAHGTPVLLAVPGQLARLVVAVEGGAPAPRLRRIATGSAPLDPTLAATVRRHWGEVLLDYFGSSETGTATIATAEDLRRAPGTVGRPATGVRIAVLDEEGTEVPAGAVGRVVVASPWRAAGTPRGPVATGDLGRLDADGRLFLHGRADDLVVVGGHNVSRSAVRAWFERQPGVRRVELSVEPDAVLGRRLDAAVDLAPDGPGLAELQAAARSDLGPSAPRRVTRCSRVPARAATPPW